MNLNAAATTCFLVFMLYICRLNLGLCISSSKNKCGILLAVSLTLSTLFVPILWHLNFLIHHPHLPCCSLFSKYITHTLLDVLQSRKACPLGFLTSLSLQKHVAYWFKTSTSTLKPLKRKRQFASSLLAPLKVRHRILVSTDP